MTREATKYLKIENSLTRKKNLQEEINHMPPTLRHSNIFSNKFDFCLFKFRSHVPTLNFRAAVKLFDTKKSFCVQFLQIHHSNELIQVSYYLMH